MRFLGIFLVPTMFGTCGHCFAEDIKPSPSTARPSMPYAETATMHVDGSLTLRLRLTSEGKDGQIGYRRMIEGSWPGARHARRGGKRSARCSWVRTAGSSPAATS